MSRWHADIWWKAIRTSSMKPLERLVARAFADYAGGNQTAWLTLPQLMQETGLSRDAANRALRGVISTGWLTVESPARQHRSAIYRLALLASSSTGGVLLNDLSSTGDGPLNRSSSAPADASSTPDDISSTRGVLNSSSSEGSTSETQTPAADAADVFAEFYELYPRKKDKPAAVKAWKTATKTKDVDPAVIVDGLRLHLPALKAQMAEEPKYVAYPARWLNEERWSEDVESSPKTVDDTPSYWRKTYCPDCGRPDVNAAGVCAACRADEISGVSADSHVETAFPGTASDSLIPVGAHSNGGPNSRAAADMAKPWQPKRRAS